MRPRWSTRLAVYTLLAALVAESRAAAGLSDRIFSPRLPNPATAQRTSVVRIPAFVDDTEIGAIHAAAAAVRADAGERLRSNGLEEDTWSTVFFNHRLAELLPSIYEKLVAAARQADAAHGWNVLDAERQSLAMRCAEYHTVHTAGGLPIKKHYDYGSLVTMDIMLSPTSDFEGGVFSTLEEDGELRPHTFERGDLLLFLSHKYHCVQPVTSGTRQVLVCELWEGLARRCNTRCDLPWGPCCCGLDMSGLYINRRDNERTDLAAVPFSRSTPVAVKHGWTALQRARASNKWLPR